MASQQHGAGRARPLFALVALLLTLNAGASPLFEASDVIDVRMSGPLRELIASDDDRAEHPFVLTAGPATFAVEVRVRGQSRRRVCAFPPLRWHFERDEVAGSVFEGQHKLKLVTHCHDRDAAERNMLEEYLAYRIFNEISDSSFRVRLLHVSYADTDKSRDNEVTRRYAFVIESARELAGRISGRPASVAAVSRNALDLEQATAVYIFQYLIGNTDWSLVSAHGEDSCCHNGYLIDRDATILYVPYDFDLSGLVNASYAKPDPSLRLKSVRQRRYRGLCVPDEVLRASLRNIKARQAEILALFHHVPGLAPDALAKPLRYVQAFFKQAEDEDKLLRAFGRRCL